MSDGCGLFSFSLYYVSRDLKLRYMTKELNHGSFV